MLFEALQRKALPEIREWLTAYALSQIMRDRFLALVELNGGGEVLEAAKQLLGADDEVQQALNTLEQLTAAIQRRIPKLPIHIDLAELRGYRYHTGVVFAAYTPGQGQAVAQGGRYDEIGQVFGRSRPATGFSADLRILLSLSAAGDDTSPKAIYAPRTDDSALDALVRALRSRGERVIYALPALDPQPEALGCDRILVMQGNNWVVAPLDVSPLKKT
jgi:ATP phosphoribosyltransferase regulatory subunit